MSVVKMTVGHAALIITYNWVMRIGDMLKEGLKKGGSFVTEFKKFALRGNVMDMTVGVIVGGALSKVVTSLVGDVFMPVLGLFTGKLEDLSKLEIVLSEVDNVKNSIKVGAFISGLVDFFLTALCVFFIVKLIGRLYRAKPAEAKPKRKCPFCLSDIADEATRCPHCTSQIEARHTGKTT